MPKTLKESYDEINREYQSMVQGFNNEIMKLEADKKELFADKKKNRSTCPNGHELIKQVLTDGSIECDHCGVSGL